MYEANNAKRMFDPTTDRSYLGIKPILLRSFAEIFLFLYPQPEQYLVHHDPVQVHILLHEAHRLGNPFVEGIPMMAGKTYNVFINQRVTERLKAPYQTNCTDYLKLWKKNGGYGPLTGKACSEQCIVENMLETEGCVAQTISYPGNYTICEDEDTYPSDDINKKCSLQCKDACRASRCSATSAATWACGWGYPWWLSSTSPKPWWPWSPTRSGTRERRRPYTATNDICIPKNYFILGLFFS
ncbi:hypothetical protein AVEN_28710-1 [Araneus ventricosus]|uniref:Uncharacterized protein n=1 Tax=Araneus ventricosus TaxID=182803 RepID=A0A4Y2J5D5_ARAVE|nr:hypothetical protein AVEN_28710-1 [Araneus ventricosus]